MLYYQVEPAILRILAGGNLGRIETLIERLREDPELSEHLARNLIGDAVKVATVETIEYLIEKLGRPTEGMMLPYIEDGEEEPIDRSKMLWLYRQGLLHSCQVRRVRDTAVTSILSLVLFLEVPFQAGNIDQFTLAIDGIVQRDDLLTAFWMCRSYPDCVQEFMAESVSSAHPVFFYQFYHAFEDGFFPAADLMIHAFCGGSMEIIRFLMDRGGVPDRNCLEVVIQCGNMEAFLFCYELLAPSLTIPDITDLCYLGCKESRLEFAKYLYAKGAKISPLEAQRRMPNEGHFTGMASNILSWLLALEEDRKTFMERVIESEKDVILKPLFLDGEKWLKTATEVFLENGFDYHQLSGKYKYIIAPLLVPGKIRRIRMRKFGWFWHQRWLAKSGNPNNPRGAFLREWIATIPTDFVHE